MNSMESIRNTLEPTKFNSSTCLDPTEWIRRFDLFSKLNKFDEQDKIDLLELFLKGKDLIWYRKCKTKMSDWENTKELFIAKFDGRDGEIRAWTDLQGLKQVTFSNFGDFKAEFNRLVIRAKIEDESVCLKIFTAALKPKYQKMVIKSKKNCVQDATEMIQEEQHLERMISGIEPKSNKIESATSKKDKQILKVHKSENDSEMYEALISKFDKLSIIILSLLENKASQKPRSKEYSPEVLEMIKKGECFHCHQTGHMKNECPMFKQQNKDLGCLDVEDLPENSYDLGSLLALEKRVREATKEKKVDLPKTKIQRTEKNKSAVRSYEISSSKPNYSIRRRYDIKISENTEKYSIKHDLDRFVPNINMSQLLHASPSIQSDLKNLFKKIESREVNSIGKDKVNVTNCKALIEIFGRH